MTGVKNRWLGAVSQRLMEGHRLVALQPFFTLSPRVSSVQRSAYCLSPGIVSTAEETILRRSSDLSPRALAASVAFTMKGILRPRSNTFQYSHGSPYFFSNHMSYLSRKVSMSGIDGEGRPE